MGIEGLKGAVGFVINMGLNPFDIPVELFAVGGMSGYFADDLLVISHAEFGGNGGAAFGVAEEMIGKAIVGVGCGILFILHVLRGFPESDEPRKIARLNSISKTSQKNDFGFRRVG